MEPTETSGMTVGHKNMECGMNAKDRESRDPAPILEYGVSVIAAKAKRGNPPDVRTCGQYGQCGQCGHADVRMCHGCRTFGQFQGFQAWRLVTLSLSLPVAALCISSRCAALVALRCVALVASRWVGWRWTGSGVTKAVRGL